MGERRIDGFFYGLFMDSDILHDSNVLPANPRHAYVDDYGLRIGQRATLVPVPGARAYGMLYSMTHEELETLYTGPGLELYSPEAVLAQSLDGSAFPALCYNLREAPAPDAANPEYATRLRAALEKLNFPVDYIESVA